MIFPFRVEVVCLILFLMVRMVIKKQLLFHAFSEE